MPIVDLWEGGQDLCDLVRDGGRLGRVGGVREEEGEERAHLAALPRQRLVKGAPRVRIEGR